MALFITLSELLKGGPKNIKRRLLRDILLILFVTTGAIIAIGFVQGIKTQRDISTALINKANKRANIQFQSFIEPLNNTMQLLGKWGELGLLRLSDLSLLATQFQALMEIQSSIRIISLADQNENATHLSHDKNQWVLFQQLKSKTIYSRWVDGKSIDEKIVTTSSSNPQSTSWFRGAMTKSPGTIFISDPHPLPETGEVGVTISLCWYDKKRENSAHVSAISFSIKDLLKFMQNLKISKNSHILLLHKDVTLLSNIQNNTIHRSTPPTTNVTIPSRELLETAIQKFKTSSVQTGQPISIKNNGSIWWLGLSQLHNANEDLWIAILIPENDIFEDLHKQWLQFGILVFSILLFSIIMTIFLVRRYGHQLKDLPQQHIGRYGLESKIDALIKAGESTTLEFKSTMRTNLKTGKIGKEIEIAWLKTVVAFMNSDGGILLIGVADTGKILGTEIDNFVNEDKCRLHFKNMLNTHIGAEFTRFIHLKVVTIQKKTILVVECERVRRPVFLSMGKQEDFFIRSGPSSMKLSMSKMVKYLGER